METNSTKNKAKIGEIRELVKVIKGKVMGANENLKLINENRERFDKATKAKREQLEEAVRRSQEENTKKMAELQNQQVEAKKAADKRIQEIESKSKSDLEETQRLLNEKHKKDLQDKIDALTASEESKTALEDKQKEAQIELERIKEENRKQKEANDDDIRTRQNELELVNQTLTKNKQELDRIMGEVTNKDKKIQELKLLIDKSNQEKQELNAQHTTALTELGEKNTRLIEQNIQTTKELNTKHDEALVELNKKHEEAMKEIKLKMLAEFEQQKKDAVEATVAMKDQEAELKVSASKGEIEIIKQRVEQCDEDKKRFSEQLLAAQKTIEGLKRNYDNQEEASLEQLKQEVNDVDNLLEKAVSTLKLSREIAGTDATKGDVDDGAGENEEETTESDDGAGENEEETTESDDGGKKQTPTDLPEGWKEAIDPKSGRIYYYNETTDESQWEIPTESVGKAKVDDEEDEEHPLEIKKEVKKTAWENFLKIKNAFKAKKNFERNAENYKLQTLLIGKDKNSGIVREYVMNIDDNQLDELTKRIVDPKLHGMEKSETGPKFHEALKSVINDPSKKHYKQHQEMYFRILKSMIAHHSEYYVSLAEEIEKVKFEKTLEQLLTAFHLVWGDTNIKNLYAFGHEKKREGYKDKVFKDLGEVALNLWGTKGPHDYDSKVRTMKNAPPHIKRDNANFYRYYHEHDHRKEKVKEAWAKAGGFRHGKRSKKQNRRSLKSKLKAKKYSLKSKKRGKNKSKKRRKSIKIRIK